LIDNTTHTPDRGKGQTMCDIISTTAWSCGFEDNCTVGWHCANYWLDTDGTYTVDRYSDGDHEGIDADELPTIEEVDKSWQDYAAYVARSGLDPLGNFNVKHTTKKKERYTATFRHMPWAGTVLWEVKRGGKALPVRGLPERVTEYLDVERKDEASAWMWRGAWEHLTGLECVKTLPLKKGECMASAVVTFTIDYDCPRPAATVTAELRQLAKRQLTKKTA